MSEPLEPPVDENKLIAERRAKLAALRARGLPAFPNDFRPDSQAAELHLGYDQSEAAAIEAQAIRVKVAGRMMLRRIMGKASFAHLQDVSGQIQLFLQRDVLTEAYDSFKSWDIGDIVAAEGVLFKTKTGELSVRVESVRLLVKSLRPLPDKWHGLADTESRYRQRYVDLIMNDASRTVFRQRTQLVRFVRSMLDALGFLEVETPMMQPIPGGAAARPFVTHHNALDQDMFLRVAPELFLKRLGDGGFYKVFELNRNFRNEGLSTRHNPEFTMLEFYQAYARYEDLMNLTEDLFRTIASEVIGSTRINYQGTEIDFNQPFARLTVVEAIKQVCRIEDGNAFSSQTALVKLADKLNVQIDKGWPAGKVLMEIFEQKVESQLMQPTFITEYPIEVSPLARRNEANPEVTDRFELIITGRELANGFSELNDPEDQAERFHAQVEQKDAGDSEAMHFDEDYITALEYGMPPSAGEGIGIDRLVMLFTNATSIKDVLLFPHMRPLQDEH